MFPSDLTIHWQKWLDNLPDIQNITLDRWCRSTDTDIELLIFADASKIAYGIPCYIKVNNQPKCSFGMSKSKDASVNKKSKCIPQLELQAALTASQLKQKITREFKITIKEPFMWTDSKMVLNYL